MHEEETSDRGFYESIVGELSYAVSEEEHLEDMFEFTYVSRPTTALPPTFCRCLSPADVHSMPASSFSTSISLTDLLYFSGLQLWARRIFPRPDLVCIAGEAAPGRLPSAPEGEGIRWRNWRLVSGGSQVEI